jgi:hypothetical protein
VFVLTFLLFLLVRQASAQAGPPFRTDDPETPGNKHWEINVGWLGDRNPDEGSYSVPNLDINYGLGHRIQLKYELPLAMREERGATDEAGPGGPIDAYKTDFGLGDSLLGVKWRFFEHMPTHPEASSSDDEDPEPNFSVSTYPQFALNSPSRLAMETESHGTQFLLPLEANACIGPIRIDAELGYWFTNGKAPQSLLFGMIVGHEFTRKTEAYLELYDQQDSTRVNGAAKQHQATVGLGGRHALDRYNNVRLLMMGGRSFQKLAPGNGQPSWIAYVGIQFLFGPQHRYR